MPARDRGTKGRRRPRPEPTPETETYNAVQIAEYEAYLEFIGNNPDAGFPVPRDIDDYFERRDEWEKEYAPPPPPPEEEAPPSEEVPPGEEPPPREEVPPGEEVPPEEAEYSDEDYREYYTYRNYASAYGDPSDWYPLNIADYFANWDISQEQLTEWKAEETAKATERTEYEQEREEAKQYDLSPLESALRRQESYEYGKWARAQSKYGAQEAYRETPEYGKQLYGWLGGQEPKSEPLQQWMRAMFPTFQREYEAGLPRLTGFPTREAARTEATKREAGLEQWLGAQESALEERFYMQRPYERGERPSLFAPRLREVSY